MTEPEFLANAYLTRIEDAMLSDFAVDLPGASAALHLLAEVWADLGESTERIERMRDMIDDMRDTVLLGFDARTAEA